MPSLARKLYPLELQQHIRDQIAEVLGTELELKMVEIGNEVSFPKHDPRAHLPATYVQLIEWDPTPGPPLGACQVEYIFSIAYFRALEPGESAQENVVQPVRLLSEFFLRDDYRLPLFAAPGCAVESVLPGKAEFGELGKFRFEKVSITVEGGAFLLTVKTRSTPIEIP